MPPGAGITTQPCGVEGRFAWGIVSEQALVVHVNAGSDFGKVRRVAERLAKERAKADAR
jgi:hypothetical protein